MSESNDAEENEVTDLQLLLDAYINNLNSLPLQPPGSSPPSHLHLVNDVLDSIGPHTELNICAMMAQIVHFPNLPDKWTRIMYHAYNDVYSSVGTNLPRIPVSSVVPRSIHRAKSRCLASNPEWRPNEHELIDIDGVQVHTRWNSLEFRTKFKSTVTLACGSFHDHSFYCTLYLLTSQPGYNALMPFMPVRGVMMFNVEQKRLVEWYATWSDTFGYIMWHHPNDDNLFFFANGFVRQFLHSALKDTSSPGFFGIQEPYRNNQGEWKWRPLMALGDKALVVLSYALGSFATSIYADFGMQRNWQKHRCCDARRKMVLESQKRIYQWLKKVTDLTVPGLTLAVCQRLRDALIMLLAELGFSL